jgi:hypothetical protein
MPEPIRIREDLPANLGVLAYLSPPAGHAPLAEAPEDHADPYQGAGSHPDVVEHLWVRLNGALPADCRVVVYGSPALAHPEAGVILALAMGTSYALRLQSADRDTAMAAGAEPGPRVLGPEGPRGERAVAARLRLWVFGRWDRREPAWCARSYAAWSAR